MRINDINYRTDYGTYVGDQSSNLGYIPIPKNASSFMREWVAANFNWTTTYDYGIAPKDQYIVILRDPFERWLAGVAQYMPKEHNYLNLTNDKILRFVCKHVEFDEHTKLQVDFLRGLDTKNIIFFPFNKNLSILLKNYCKNNKLLDNYIDVPFINVSNHDTLKFKFKTALRDFLHKNPEYVDSIKKYYEADYKLLSTIKFAFGA